MVDILQFCKWFVLVKWWEGKVFHVADCNWNSTTVINQLWTFSHKTVQLGINQSRFNDDINVSGSFLLSFLWPPNGALPPAFHPFPGRKNKRRVTRKRGVAVIIRKQNFHRNFLLKTFTYISVAKTVSDNLCIAKQSGKYRSSTGYIVTLNTI